MSEFIFHFLVVSTAFAGLLSELIQAHILSITWGGMITQLTLVFATYIFSLGLGAAYSPKQGNPAKQFIFLQFTLCILGTISPFLLFYVNYHLSEVLSYSLSFLIVTLIGFMSGFELPLLFRLYDKKAFAFEKIMSLDYLGMAFGSLLFSTIFLQVLGFWNSVFINSLINCLIGILAITYFQKQEKLKEKAKNYLLGFFLASTCIGGVLTEPLIFDLVQGWLIK